ncbi:MAG: ATP-binding cassette domain-containing protein, partial [Gammaproteobacteria bacterium]|nr:ATP-binding cassette domain-containing protein [Gammaproteobacteria bacterium]
GAGKSTTMKMITGFLVPDGGSVKVGGDDVTRAPIAVKRRIGYLPEGAPLYGDMTPRSFLHFIAEIRGLHGAQRKAGIERAVQRTGLESVLEKPIETLSKGFKRRVGLAQAILHDPPVLVLDEPTDGLDPNQKHEVRGLIRDMAADKAIVLSTHILEEVEAVCDRAVIIAQGRIVRDGRPDELLAESSTHNAITLTLCGVDADRARGALGILSGVRQVETVAQTDAGVTLRVLPVQGSSLLGAVNQCLREHGWSADELYVERGRLDDVFRHITGGDSGQRS